MPAELSAEEKKLPYFKYWNREIKPLSAEKVQLIEGPAMAPAEALPFARRNDLISGNDVAKKRGFCVMEDGTGYVANKLFMPEVTPTMFLWWFAWHSVGDDLRYKIWDKDDHYYARADKPAYVCDPAVPLAEKTWNVSHSIREDIGAGPNELLLHFMNPKDAGYDPACIGTARCAALVCGFGEGDAPALMTHICQEIDGGIQMYSRFWMGYGLVDGKAVKLLPEGIRIPEIAPRSLFAHCVKEFTHLASFLPEIYREEKDNWFSR